MCVCVLSTHVSEFVVFFIVPVYVCVFLYPLVLFLFFVVLFFAHSRDFRKFNLHFVAKHSENRMQKAGESAEASERERERGRVRIRGNDHAPMETFVALVSFSYFFLMFSVVLIPFLALCRRLSQCVCVSVRVCSHESPCAMRSWINTLVADWQASSSSLRISQAKQANVENIISHTHKHTRTYTNSHQYTGTKIGISCLF